MWEWIDKTLQGFRPCFSRGASFRWFVIIVIGLMIRSDALGVTSIIRDLMINPSYYVTMLHFFRADSWQVSKIRDAWIRIVTKIGCLFTEDNVPILVGDGVKESKEGKHMPCVKRLHQESETSSKPSYIFGHMFGCVGILIGNVTKIFCLPLSMTIHDGDKQIRQWLNTQDQEESHVVRLIRDACHIAKLTTHSILLLDRYYLTVPALEMLGSLTQNGRALLTLVTKAKSNVIAYERPGQRKTGKGRPPKKGKSIKLSTLFEDESHLFTTTEILMYGKMERVSFLCKDLLWGQKLYQPLRFVLVQFGDTRSILVCTDTTFAPEKIIRLYSYRFKIETCFRELKQVIAGFSYHFWSKSMPKLNRFAKSGTDTLEGVVDKDDKRRILGAFKAISGFVMFACIAIGLVQMCSLTFADNINSSSLRWIRTRSNQVPSEATTVDFMRKSIFTMFRFAPDLSITQFITNAQTIKCDDYQLGDLRDIG